MPKIKLTPFFPTVVLSLLFGIAGEALLHVEAQCRRAASVLAEDFRILVFLSPSLSDGRQKEIEDALLRLSGVRSVRLVTPEAALEEMHREDPELSRSVALLGENPLSAAFEVEIRPEAVNRVSERAAAAAAMEGVEDVRYRRLQAGALAHMQLYGWFLRSVILCCALLWLAAVAASLWARRGALEPGRILWRRAGGAGLAAASGALLVLAVVFPLSSVAPKIWPPLWAQFLLVLAGCGWGIILPLVPATADPPPPEPPPPPSSLPIEEARELEALSADALL